MGDADELRQAVRRHYDQFWPGHPQDEVRWPLRPPVDYLPDLVVRRVAPLRWEDPWVYATVGASAVTGTHPLEFFLIAPAESPVHVETLTMAANFHGDPRYHLYLGRTIDIGRPWHPGSSLDHLLVSLPYPYGPGVEHCFARDRHVRVLWLLPITAAEARYARERGIEALEQLLETYAVDTLALDRPSVV